MKALWKVEGCKNYNLSEILTQVGVNFGGVIILNVD